MGQDNVIYKFSIKLSFSSKEQNKSKLQKQISNILISTVTAASYNDKNDARWWWRNKRMHTIEIKWKNGYVTGGEGGRGSIVRAK